jgi:hypothetical protein
VRYADDLVVGFEYEDDARRFLDVWIAHYANLGATRENDRFRPVSLSTPARPGCPCRNDASPRRASEESHGPHLDAFAPRGVRRGGRILERGVADEA